MKHAKALHSLPISSVDRRAVAKRLAEIAETSGPVAANRARAALSAFFTWAWRAGEAEQNPVALTDKAVEGGARERSLSDAELRTIWLALDDRDYDGILKLLLLTGARRDEIGSLCWSEVDLDAATITLPPARTKNKREHIVPLNAPALETFRARREEEANRAPGFVFGRGLGRRGFQGWSRGRRELGRDSQPSASRRQTGRRMISDAPCRPGCMKRARRRTLSRRFWDTLAATRLASLASTTKPCISTIAAAPCRAGATTSSPWPAASRRRRKSSN